MTDVVAPPGARRDISRALDEFAALLGPEAVLTADADLREFRDPYSFVGWEEHTASAIVSPTTVEQVQAIVRIAGEHGVPLWTFSQGRNNGYGGPAPRVRGSVLVNLRGMNRVLEVDEDLGFALVEPGVRFFDLYEHLGRTVDHRLWLSIPDLGWGSVIGNTLDHGFGFNPLGDHPASDFDRAIRHLGRRRRHCERQQQSVHHKQFEKPTNHIFSFIEFTARLYRIDCFAYPRRSTFIYQVLARPISTWSNMRWK